MQVSCCGEAAFLLECPSSLISKMLPAMKRRDFLGLTTLAAGTLALNPMTGSTLAEAADVPALDIPWIQLTKEVKAPRIGFGTGMNGAMRRSDMIRGGYPKALEMIHYAYDRGIRLFDCADLYGTHDVVKTALSGKPRDSYVLVSKLWLLPGGIPEKERLDPAETVDRFLWELGTDYIDVLQIHCMQNDGWTRQFENAMESMAKLKKAGKIRAHGISTHSNAAAELGAQTDWCDAVHVRINNQGMHMDGPQNDPAARVAETIRAAKKVHDAGKGVIAMKVLGQGDMKDPEMRKKATKFIADLDCISTILVGFTEKEQISEFLTNFAEVQAGVQKG